MSESEHSLSIFLVFLLVVVLLEMSSVVKEFMQHFHKQSKAVINILLFGEFIYSGTINNPNYKSECKQIFPFPELRYKAEVQFG